MATLTRRERKRLWRSRWLARPTLAQYIAFNADYFRMIGTPEARYVCQILDDAAEAAELLGASTPEQLETALAEASKGGES